MASAWGGMLPYEGAVHLLTNVPCLDVMFKCFIEKNMAPLIKDLSVPASLRQVGKNIRIL